MTNWNREYGTVAYVSDRVMVRAEQGMPFNEAVLDTAAKLDEDLYIQMLHDGVASAKDLDLDEYLMVYYSDSKNWKGK